MERRGAVLIRLRGYNSGRRGAPHSITFLLDYGGIRVAGAELRVIKRCDYDGASRLVIKNIAFSWRGGQES